MIASRRALLRNSALTVPLLAMSGCGAWTWVKAHVTDITTVTQTVVNDVQSVNTALQSELSALQGILGASTAKAAQVAAFVAQLAVAGGKIVVGMAAAAAQPLVQQIQADWNNIKGAVSGFSLPTAVQKVMQAIDVVMPLILLAVGLAPPAAAAPGGMTPAQARAVLAGVR